MKNKDKTKAEAKEVQPKVDFDVIEKKVQAMPDGPTKQAMLRDIEVKKAKTVTK